MTQPDSYNWGSANATDTAYFRTTLSPMSAALILNAYAGGEIPDNQDHNTLFRNNYLWQQYLLTRQKSSEPTLLRSTGTATWNGSDLVLSANLDLSFRKDLGEQINRIASGTISLTDGQVLVVRRDETTASPVTLSSVAYGSLALGTYAIVAESSLTATDMEYQTVVFRRKGTTLEIPMLGLVFSSGDTITFGKPSISGLTLTGTVPFKTNSADSLFDIYAAGAGVYCGRVNRYSARGTVAAPTVSQNGDYSAFNASYLYDGDQYIQADQDYVYASAAPANNAIAVNRIFSLSGGGSAVEALFGMFGATSSIGLRDGGKLYLDMDSGGVVGDTYLDHSSNTIQGYAGGALSFIASSEKITIGTQNANLTLGGSPSGNGSGRIQFINANSAINWDISTSIFSNGDLTFTPSTVAGGITFSTAALTISSAGKASFLNEVLLPDVDPPTANYVNRNSFAKARGTIILAGNGATVTAVSSNDYNVSSVSMSGTTTLTVNFDTDFLTGAYSCIIGKAATTVTGTEGLGTPYVTNKGGANFDVKMNSDSTGSTAAPLCAVAIPSVHGYDFVAFGVQ